MAVFWISFRIADKTVNGKTYNQRRDGLETAIGSVSSAWWKETTSFIVFETRQTLETVARTIKREIAPACDLFLIRRMDAKAAIICGNNDEPEIYDLFKHDGKTYLKSI